MIKRTLYFTRPGHLTVKDKQLVVSLKGTDEIKTVPVEDIGFMIIENMQLTLSTPLIEKLMDNNVAVIFCNSKHHPQSMLLNMEGNHMQAEIYRQQANASEPLKKNLWKQTIITKIENQSKVLQKATGNPASLPSLAKQVKSGDSDNREGMAARIYWKNLFGKDFIRDRYGDWPNALLNYGYIVLRAAMARALVGSGLLPSFGIFHRNRFNAFCLADDMMEPYRPMVDLLVFDLCQKYPDMEVLEKEIKAEILQLLSADVQMKESTRPLMIALTQTSASLAACFKGERKNLEFGYVIT